MEVTKQIFLGFSSAPPLTDEILAKYQNAISLNSTELNKVQLAILQELLACVEKWWSLPESKSKRQLHVSRAAFVTPLDPEIQDQLSSKLPSPTDIAVYESCLDGITETTTRNMAFHLLWFVKELALGKREPVTTDLLIQ